MSETLDRFRDWDAAYVLGSLSSDDRREYERHLAGCPECAAALAELAGLPGILGKLPAHDAVAIMNGSDAHPLDEQLRDHPHTPGLVQRLASNASRRRRRVRLSLIAALVAVVAVVAVGGITFGLNQPAKQATFAMAPVHQKVVTASLVVTAKGWGTSFAWSCDYHGDAWEGQTEHYDLVVVTRNGHESTVASWSSNGPDAVGLTASSAIKRSDISSVEIRLTGTTAPLLRANL